MRDRAWTLYLEGIPQAEIARRLKVTRQRIHHLLSRAKSWLSTEERAAIRLAFNERCNACGQTTADSDGEVHHLTRSGTARDERRENLLWVCIPCHRRLHSAEGRRPHVQAPLPTPTAYSGSCNACGQTFNSSHSGASYCSDRCRWRMKKRRYRTRMVHPVAEVPA